MKLKAITLALFVAGIASSYALADNGGGKGNGKKEAAASATTTAGTTTSDSDHGKGKAKQADKKVTICHRAGKSGKFVKITVSRHALKAHKRHGDVEPVDGKCASAPPTTTASTTTTSGSATASSTK